MSWRDHLAKKEVERLQRAHGGRRAVRAGRVAEDAVDRVNHWYERELLAIGRHRPTPTKPIGRRNGRPELIYSEPAGVDYPCIVRGPSGPIPVPFELKSSSTASLPRHKPDGSPVLSVSQVEELAAAHAIGAPSAVMVTVKTKPRGAAPVMRWFWLPWLRWLAADRAAADAGRQSIGVEPLCEHGFEIAPHPMVDGPDWLLAFWAAQAAS